MGVCLQDPIPCANGTYRDTTGAEKATDCIDCALGQYCASEGLEDVINGSAYRDSSFNDAYGVRMVDGGMRGFFSRAVVVIDAAGKVSYTEQVPSIGQEPDYESALAAL